ncbi:MAG: SAM-dependent chlorinase/fluorinase [Prevotellaceae bacterium]|jgi:S-adenosylmethionine hydrolase|nr:SAM-dependent chlorinase/fluorinase [Prevotellaceae bacterium]
MKTVANTEFMPILTLTTDWGTSDHYVASLKGCILGQCPDVKIVDITHYVAAYDPQTAAFTVSAVYQSFPIGSVHFVGVEANVTEEQPLVAAKVNGHFFIWVNNGYLSLLAPSFDAVISVQSTPPNNAAIARIVQHICQKNEIGALGLPLQPKKLLAKIPTIQPNSIVGQILHFDSYGNTITNITKPLFDEAAKGRNGKIYINSMAYKVPRLYSTYTDVPDGSPVAFFNGQNLLEVACCRGNARKLYRLSKDQSSIMVKFDAAPEARA